uniref:Phytocyanin domain-containing protein n=1 Tax=Aegilops tauschii subsp. strangulata TaxID=200361 RepID=A0A453HNB9_AEGTS
MAAWGRGNAAGSKALVAGAAFLCMAAVLLAATPAAEAGATTYLVGDAAGWTRNVDYGGWLAGKIFRAGDVLGTYLCAMHVRASSLGRLIPI